MASDRELEWLDLYLDTGDAAGAVRQVFPDNSNPVVRASQLKAKLTDEIEQRLRGQFMRDAPKMYNIVKDLALTADQQSVKLKAAQDILSRSGMNAVSETRDLTEKPNEAELKDRLKMALAGIDKDTLKEILGSDTLQTLARQIQDEPEEATKH